MRMTDGYDTHNLRYDAAFFQPIFPGVNWVPVNMLGKTRYTTKEILSIIPLSAKERCQKINCLYEAIQLLQIGCFKSIEDNQTCNIKNINWALHTSGCEAFERNGGCCASVVNWMYYVLSSCYYEVGILTVLANSGRGHAFNYVRHQGKMYIVDPNAFIMEHKEYVRPETGMLYDFRKSRIITAALFQVDSFEDFSDFFSTYVGRLAKRSFLFCQHKSEIRWEGYRLLNDNTVETFWPEKTRIIKCPPNFIVNTIKELPFNLLEKEKL